MSATSTKERLATALEQAGAPAPMIHDARRGRYDDFTGDSPTPIHDLVRDARACGLAGIAERAMAGEFDGTREEAEAWAAEGRRTNPELARMLDALERGEKR